MSGEHTPGPWAVLNPNAKHGFATIGTRGPSGPTRHIAETCWHDEQGIADALLIAAAPELLEALEVAMQWIKAWDVGFLFDDEWPADEAKITAAIAKARGEA